MLIENALKSLRKHNIKIKDYTQDTISVYDNSISKSKRILEKSFIIENKENTIILKDKKKKEKCECGGKCCQEETTSADVAVDEPLANPKKVSFKDYLLRRIV